MSPYLVWREWRLNKLSAQYDEGMAMYSMYKQVLSDAEKTPSQKLKDCETIYLWWEGVLDHPNRKKFMRRFFKTKQDKLLK
jgi:hypothetical protein